MAKEVSARVSMHQACGRAVCALAVVALVLPSLACTTASVVRVEMPAEPTTTSPRRGAPRERLVQPRDRGFKPVHATWAMEGDRTVVGQLSWSKECSVEKETLFVEKEKTTVSSNVGANVAWLGLGLAALGGGAGLATYGATEASTVDNCPSRRENGEGGCWSDRTWFYFSAIWTSAAGLGSAISGSAGLARSDKVSERELQRGYRRTGRQANVACGTASLGGVELTLEAPGLTDLRATSGADGSVRFLLPQDSWVMPGAKAVVRATFRPAALREALSAGPLGTPVGLETYAAGVAARRAEAQAAAQRAADDHVFTGAIHGDAEAKRALTFDCQPDGEDLCFDAIDNDCDGLYDLGCGYQNGALQWTLAWRTGDDLDLHLIGPDGAHVFYASRKGGAAGLKLDVDCLGAFGNNCLAQNVENIFTPQDQKPMEGTYRGYVEVYRAVGGDPGRVIEAMLGGRIAGKTFRMPMRLQAQNKVRIFFAFAIGDDGDGDSVIDREDACPDVAGVFSTFTAECGCLDRDLDGISDGVDQCPDEPGVRVPRRGGLVGCPRTYGKARLTDRGVEISEAILFATGSAVIMPQSFELLDDIADVMRDAPDMLKSIGIMGHTDSDGEEMDNRKLSIKRAEAVRDHLHKRGRIATRRLVTLGFGEDRPRASNDTPAGKRLNRRVEFRVLSPEFPGMQSW